MMNLSAGAESHGWRGFQRVSRFAICRMPGGFWGMGKGRNISEGVYCRVGSVAGGLRGHFGLLPRRFYTAQFHCGVKALPHGLIPASKHRRITAFPLSKGSADQTITRAGKTTFNAY